jgi:hypothetical protein
MKILLSLACVLLSGCFGTEGGNPPLTPDAGPSCGDAGPPPAPLSLCEPGTSLPDCACTAGERTELVTNGSAGQRAVLVGPTSTGGVVSVQQRVCVSGCTVDHSARLDVFRFDAAGAAVGDPIEVTTSAEYIELGAVLVGGDTLAIAWGDERDVEPGTSNIWFAQIDLETGAFLVEPHLVIPTRSSVFEVRLARGTDGYALVYNVTNTEIPSVAGDGVFFVRLDDAGSPIGEPTMVGANDLRTSQPFALALEPSGGRFALLRWHVDALLFTSISEDGTAAAPVTLALGRGARQGRPFLRASGQAYVAGWSDGRGVRVAHVALDGTITSEVFDVADGELDGLLVEESGSIALAWIPLAPCALHALDARQLVLTRLGTDGVRAHRDVLLHEGSSPYGADLVELADGLRASFMTFGPSRSWLIPACVPVP